MKLNVRKVILIKPKKLHSVIKPQILTYIAVKNLTAKKLRTGLTMVGIIIGVGAVEFLVSLAIGLHGVVNQQVLGSKSVNTIDVTTPNSQTILLNDQNINKIRQYANVKTVAPAYILAGQVSFQGSQTDTVVYGTNNQYINLSQLKFVAGNRQLINSSSAIVNTSILNLIGQTNPKKAINTKISLSATINEANSQKIKINSNLIITGVVSTGSGSEIYTSGRPFTLAEAPQYGQVKVQATNRASVPVLRKQIEGLGLTTASPLDTLDQINTIFSIFTFVVIGFGGIGMIIAILGMFNTLTISLLERTGEIGLMITMGARKADIQKLLIYEALILSVGGGILGIFAAWILGQVINLIITDLAGSRGVNGTIHALSVTPLLVAVTLLLTVVIGFLVAFYPSKRASRINPIEALKHE